MALGGVDEKADEEDPTDQENRACRGAQAPSLAPLSDLNEISAAVVKHRSGHRSGLRRLEFTSLIEVDEQR
jgi:hypothetical protein